MQKRKIVLYPPSLHLKKGVKRMKDVVIRTIEQQRMIAIIRGVAQEKLIPLAQALYDGGIRLMEVTYSANGSVPDEATAQCIHRLSSHFQGSMLFGAGTVLNCEQVRLTKEAGGLFIISPNTDAGVIAETCRQGLVSIPGALTPTEIMNAHSCGADFVKLFPVSNLGVEYVKAVRAPLSHVKLLAVGGIDENNMADYLKAGICGFGVGSNITNKRMIDNNDWNGITALAKKYTEVLKHG